MTNDNNGFLASRTQSWMNSFCVRLRILSIFSRQALRLAPLQQKWMNRFANRRNAG
jgi:hypothetical protein